MNTDKKSETPPSEVSFPRARRAVYIIILEIVIPFLAERDYQIAIERLDRCEQECIQADDPDKDAMLDELKFIRAFLQGSVEVRPKVEGNLNQLNPT